MIASSVSTGIWTADKTPMILPSAKAALLAAQTSACQIDNLAQNSTHVKVIRSLGSGSSGTVLLVRVTQLRPASASRHRQSTQLVAMKEVVGEYEQHILSTLCHPNIVQLRGCLRSPSLPSRDTKTLFLLLEYVNGPELFQLINQHSLCVSLISDIFWQLVSALHYLHALKRLVHGDIKPENILVQSACRANWIKLVDFGMCRPADKWCRGPWGSPEYACPEMASGKWYDPAKAEMWSLGVVLYTMINRALPASIPAGSEDCSHPLHPILQALLSRDPRRRPSCAQLLNTKLRRQF